MTLPTHHHIPTQIIFDSDLNHAYPISALGRRGSILEDYSTNSAMEIGEDQMPVMQSHNSYLNRIQRSCLRKVLSAIRNSAIFKWVMYIVSSISMYYARYYLLKRHSPGQVIFTHNILSILIIVIVQKSHKEGINLKMDDRTIIYVGVVSCVSLLLTIYAMSLKYVSLIISLESLFSNLFALNNAHDIDQWSDRILAIGTGLSISIFGLSLFSDIPHYNECFAIMLLAVVMSESSKTYLNTQVINTSLTRQLYYSLIKAILSPIWMFASISHWHIFSYSRDDIILYIALSFLNRISIHFIDECINNKRLAFIRYLQMPISLYIDWLLKIELTPLIMFGSIILCISNMVSVRLIKDPQ